MSQEERKKLEIQFVRCWCVIVCIVCVSLACSPTLMDSLLTCSQVPQVKFYILQKKTIDSNYQFAIPANYSKISFSIRVLHTVVIRVLILKNIDSQFLIQ